MIENFSDGGPVRAHDICIVGAGPIGIALAFACAKAGMNVLMLESGLAAPDAAQIELGRGLFADPATHTALEEANCRALGGTSHWWGGRLIPFDAIDFARRPWVTHAAWPLAYEDFARWSDAAADFFQCGPAQFALPNPWPELTGVRFDELERWAPSPNLKHLYGEALAQSRRIQLLLGATVTDLEFADDLTRVVSLTAKDRTRTISISSPRIALACGGVQTQRLMLSVQKTRPSLFGGVDGPLGRFYMGHNFGKIAEVVLNDPARAADFKFFMHEGAYVRRRFTIPAETQTRDKLLQISFSPGNALIAEPEHRSGALSAMWLALASPLGKRILSPALLRLYVGEERRYGAHIANIATDFFPTMWALRGILWNKYVRRPSEPNVFLRNRGGRYTLFYHAEQTPAADNRITLASETDALGMPRALVAFSYSMPDCEAIVRAHHVLADALRESGVATLEFKDGDDAARAANVRAQARDGMHQIGGARMSATPNQGVVDGNCRVHGVDNLFVTSTCVFPTSGHANPTFTGVMLALRLADQLAKARAIATT